MEELFTASGHFRKGLSGKSLILNSDNLRMIHRESTAGKLPKLSCAGWVFPTIRSDGHVGSRAKLLTGQNLKRFVCIRLWSVIVAIVGALISASAQPHSFTFNGGFSNGGLVPDGNPVGWSDTRLITGINPGTSGILDVNVFLTVNGGFNGDLYGYLVHSDGFAVLLNRPGRTSGNAFGYGNAGMNLHFDDSAANDIHHYQLVVSYPTALNDGSGWQPDGRNVNPAAVNGTELQTSLLSSFNGESINGSWTLFLADLSVGETSTVESWGVQVVTVPEPSTWALMGVGLLCGGWRFFRKRNRA